MRLQRMKFALATFAALGFFCLLPSAAHSQELIWQQNVNFSNFHDWGPSHKSQSPQYNFNSELADDFDINGTVSRIDVTGTYGGSCPAPPPGFFGVYARFYAYGADNKPGALQGEYFVAAGDPKLVVIGDSNFRITISPAFQATGKHFVTVQPLFDPGTNCSYRWFWRSADEGAPHGQSFYFRDNLNPLQSQWAQNYQNNIGNSDLAFTLYGTRILSAPTLTSLSATTLPRAGRLKVGGSNFGASQGTGVVKIGGATAIISDWSDVSITAYVAESTPLGSDTVQVVTSGRASNTMSLNVTTRPATSGRVRWRFQADGLYIEGRPAIGPDGTIYAADVYGHLYALTPNGSLKWIFSGQRNVLQSVSVGQDGTIYFAGGNIVYAINPNGTQKWQVTDPSGVAVVAGPNVGPDGNIYAVTGDSGSSGGLGAMTISPAGEILSNRTGYLEPRGGTSFTREIVFGLPSQYYFNLNNLDDNSGIQFFQLGGSFRFARPASTGALSQPAVAADGTIYTITAYLANSYAELGAYDPNGNLLRTFFGNGTTQLTSPDVGADGTIYIGQNLSNLVALNPNGSERWRFASRGILGSPIVNPANSLIAMGGYEIGEPGFVQGIDTAGQLVWEVNLPPENGGYIRPMSRPRFSDDSSTVYIGMDVNDYAADPYTYLYAIDASTTASCTYSISPTSQSFPAVGGDGSVNVTAPNGCSWMATSHDGWITITAGNSGIGNGPVNFSVSANNGGARTGTLTIAGQTFTVTQAASAIKELSDFDGDGKADIGVWRPSNGFWLIINSSNSAVQTQSWGVSGDKPVAADYDGDGKTDIAVWRPSNGTWHIINSSTGAVSSVGWGTSTDLPVPADYDGDGKTDIAVYRPSTGVWHVINSSNGAISSVSWGMSSDVPVPADYDNDGKTDIAIWRPSTGQWWIIQSSTGSVSTAAWGVNGDKPVAADYDGDGKADIAVYRPSNGTWYIINSYNGSGSSQGWGTSTDVPVPADYDGDGKADVAIWRPSTGVWWIIKSSNSATQTQSWGVSGDTAIPSAFIR
jgi:hypothetical protein